MRADPARAEAWDPLAAALEARGEFAEAYWAAERAYEADSYVEHPRDVLFRLALTAYEIGADSVASRWCDTLVERFPAEWVGAECQPRLLAWSGGGSPSVRDAWTAFDRVATSPALAVPIRARLEMLAANVLARAGCRDSAEAVIARARARSPGDSELLLLEASARALMSQPEAAASLLRRYIAVNPARRSVFAKSRRFAGLRSAIAPVPADRPDRSHGERSPHPVHSTCPSITTHVSPAPF
ncbi:MAG: hypothetical protein IRZ00_17385 [Gemmatimonadetes bacterium]|nr:hypothetical protein [Gemmatimonadota bacterium]